MSCLEVKSAGSDGISLQDRYDLVARQKGKSLKIRRDVSLDGHPGIEMYTEDEQTVLNGTARLFIVGNREYTFGVVARGADVIRAKTPQFLDSFKLMEGNGASAPPSGAPSPEKPAEATNPPPLGDSAKWQEVPLPGGKFSVLIPGTIAYKDEQTIQVKTPIKNEKARGGIDYVVAEGQVDKPTADPAGALAKACKVTER